MGASMTRNNFYKHQSTLDYVNTTSYAPPKIKALAPIIKNNHFIDSEKRHFSAPRIRIIDNLDS